MKDLYIKNLFFALIILLGVKEVNAQCTPISTSYWGEMLTNAGCGTFASYGPFGPGQYFRTPVLEGGSYTFSTCGATIDTQITGFQGTNPAYIFYNDDNGVDCATTQASITYVPAFTDYIRVNVNQYNCSAGGTSSITVKVRQNNNLAFTSSSTAMCAGDTRTLTATPATVLVAPMAGSGNVGTFTGTGVAGTTFTAPTPAGASQTYTMTYTFGYCSTTQDILVYAPPSTANAGPDQSSICGTTATLSAATPTIGSGTWTVVSGPGTVVTPGSANSSVTGLVGGNPTTLQWTVTNGPCTSSSDVVVLTVESTPPVPSMGTLSDATGQCSVTPSTPTANDNCAGVISGTPDVSFPITAFGTTVVTWTYDDGNGNTATQVQNVIVGDATAPVADLVTLADTTSFCSLNSLDVPTATDNCMGAIFGTPDVTLPITTFGTTVVTWTYDDGNGNTTTQTQNVIIGGPDATVTQTGATLTANSTPAMYQWLDCDNNYAMVIGETAQSYTPLTITGNYAVQVTENGCVDTSACYLVDYSGLEELVSSIDLTIYPNPSTGVFNVELLGLTGENLELRISDLQGRIVLSDMLEGISGKHVEKIDISKNENGVYIINVLGTNGVILTKRIIKE